MIAAGKMNERQTMVVDHMFGMVTTTTKYVKASKARVRDTNLGMSNATAGLFFFENTSSSMLALKE